MAERDSTRTGTDISATEASGLPDGGEKILYRGKPIEDYPKEALIALIRGLMAQLEGTRAAMRTLNDLSELRRHRQ